MKVIQFRKQGLHGDTIALLETYADESHEPFLKRILAPETITLVSEADKELTGHLRKSSRVYVIEMKPAKMELFRALKLEYKSLEGKIRMINLSNANPGAFKRSLNPLLKRLPAGTPACVIIIPDKVWNVMIKLIPHETQLLNPETGTSGFDPYLGSWLKTIGEKEELKSMESRFLGVSRYAVLTRALIYKAALAKSHVLLLGETGTGKSMIASLIHEYSSRRDEPFVAVNCSAVPESLFESEFFGHRKGAFTNAIEATPGHFLRAGKGTLFLDEIGELTPINQAKLLQAVESRQFYQVGASVPTKVDVRIIAATNVNLPLKVTLNSFRADLFYRLNGFQIVVQPIRDHPDDLPLIAESLWNSISGKKNSLSGTFLHYLQSKPWPGNIREIQMVLTNMHEIFSGIPPSQEGVEALKKLRMDQGLFARNEARDHFESLRNNSIKRLRETMNIIRAIRVEFRPLINQDEKVIKAPKEIRRIHVNVLQMNAQLNEFLLDPLYFKDKTLFDLIRCFSFDLDHELKGLRHQAQHFAAIWQSKLQNYYEEILNQIYKLSYEEMLYQPI
jgi:transcriptional regulator with AAA-type ATPase domain